MSDLIRREEAIKEIKKLAEKYADKQTTDASQFFVGEEDGCYSAIYILEEMKPIEPKDTLLPSGELLVDTKHANEAKSVRLMDREGFTREFEERRTGHWIMHIDDLFPADSTEECSECHEWQFIYLGNDDNYCPNCGAKMEGETYE